MAATPTDIPPTDPKGSDDVEHMDTESEPEPDSVMELLGTITASLSHLEKDNEGHRKDIKKLLTADLTKQGGETNPQDQKQIQSLTERLKTLESSLTRMTQTAQQTEQQLKKAQEENTALSKANQDLGKKLRESEAMNNELLRTILEKDTPKAHTQTQKNNVLIIGDSNIKRTKGMLDRTNTKWAVTNNIYKVTDLAQSLSSRDQELIGLAKEQDRIIIHLGTNDLRGPSTEAETYQRLMDAAESIQTQTQKPVYIAEIPPMNIPNRVDLDAKTAIFNTRIRTTRKEKITHIDMTEHYKQRTYDDLLDKDGFHLTQLGQHILKEQLEKTAIRTEAGKKGSSNTGIKTVIVTTKPSLVKHVIGKGGAIINKLTNDHSATITITNDQDSSRVTIKAVGDDADRAKEAVEAILLSRTSSLATEATKTSSKPTEAQTSSQTPKPKNAEKCKYFAKGYCRFGSRCRQQHDPEQKKRSRPLSPAQQTSTQNTELRHRTESRSPPRKREGKRHHSQKRSSFYSVLE